jgi:hypothetical protein
VNPDPEQTEDNGDKPVAFDPNMRLDWMLLVGVIALAVLAAVTVIATFIPGGTP